VNVPTTMMFPAASVARALPLAELGAFDARPPARSAIPKAGSLPSKPTSKRESVCPAASVNNPLRPLASASLSRVSSVPTLATVNE